MSASEWSVAAAVTAHEPLID